MVANSVYSLDHFRCPADGLYYRDDRSFYQCYGGDHKVQFCAPGSMNTHKSSYQAGRGSDRDFCSVNMVALQFNRSPGK
ncbi:hypothetical protein NP493_704g00018 [Ridgeia piscesae]|uniref:Uncharacterized protein n=1 Tax=Ridgeia piscesae TaxID=27915 RepID=A0AAD9NPG2_RIDPI|nr:hypothetical protein NP493_704g00018 [Ridgeia piscesae]